MLNEEDTNKDGVNTEINTPTNIWGEEEDDISEIALDDVPSVKMVGRPPFAPRVAFMVNKTHDTEDPMEKRPSINAQKAALYYDQMMTSETTNDNAVTSEITTPVTNNQVEVEEEDCIGCCFQIQRNNGQKSQRSTSGCIRKLYSRCHKQLHPTGGPEKMEEFQAELPSITGETEAPTGSIMMTSETTNDNAVTSEITTPVTNNQVEVEEEACCFPTGGNPPAVAEVSTSGCVGSFFYWRRKQLHPTGKLSLILEESSSFSTSTKEKTNSSELIVKSVGSNTDENSEHYMADNENSDHNCQGHKTPKRSLFMRLRKTFGGTASDADDEHT